MNRRSHAGVALTIAFLGAATALADRPLSDRPLSGRDRPVKLPEWLDIGAEYRVRTLYVDPLDPSGTEVTDVSWTEQRLRLDLALVYPEVGGVYFQADVLSGVLFGDNGTYGQDPSPNSGLAVATKNPNDTSWDVGLPPGADPLDTDSYVPRLRSVDPLRVVHLYGEVRLPIGLLRVGRQPFAEGANIAAHDGGPHNRWGVSSHPDVADRVLFATKLDAIADVIRHGTNAPIDPDPANGILLAATLDWNVQDSVYRTADDAWQTNIMLSWRRRRAEWLGAYWRDFVLQTIVVHKWSEEWDTAIWSFPTKLTAHIGPVFVDIQFTAIAGETREVSAGMAELSSKQPSTQDLLQLGFHGLVEYRLGPVTLGIEVDYASGDPDPRCDTTLTGFSFARDFNVGLLLFEHILAFQSARSAAVGIENLAMVAADAFPLTEVATQSRFTSAVGLFPQLRFDILEGPKHWLHARIGALFAWPDGGSVDPIVTALNEDGHRIDDDAVNWFGGSPGSYYGTELDVQVQWTYGRFFTWTIEGAVLLPGDALEDVNGDAVPSFLFENRFVFTF